MYRLIQATARITWELFDSDWNASSREIALIQEKQPSKNIASKYFFLYPYWGMRFKKNEIEFCLTTKKEYFSDYEWFGVYRSRKTASDAFYSMSFLFSFLYHKNKIKNKKPFSSIASFRRVPEEWTLKWNIFLKGKSSDILEEITLLLLDKKSARRQSEKIQEAIDCLWRFWKREALPLARAIEKAAHSSYPIEQKERDLVFLKATNLEVFDAITPCVEPSL
jgi:hypothetical protein